MCSDFWCHWGSNLKKFYSALIGHCIEHNVQLRQSKILKFAKSMTCISTYKIPSSCFTDGDFLPSLPPSLPPSPSLSRGYLLSIVSSLQEDNESLQKMLQPQPDALRPLYVYESKMVSRLVNYIIIIIHVQFIENCTKSNWERAYHQLSNHLIHIKKLRQYFTLCLLQSTCNTQVTLPINNILADIIQVCGGSKLLLKF